LHDAFVEGAKEAGFKFNPNLNAPSRKAQGRCNSRFAVGGGVRPRRLTWSRRWKGLTWRCKSGRWRVGWWPKGSARLVWPSAQDDVTRQARARREVQDWAKRAVAATRGLAWWSTCPAV